MGLYLSLLIDGPPSSANPDCRLFVLPQELQDIIFDLAYPHVSGLKVTTKQQWLNREERKKIATPHYVIRQFPAPKVTDFIVSKRFFVAAARAWVGNQTLNQDLMSSSFDVWSRKVARRQGIPGKSAELLPGNLVIDVFITELAAD